MLNIFNEVTSKRIVAYYESDENRQPLMLEAFFPRVSQKGLTFSMLKGKQGLPVALVASALDANVLWRDYEGFAISEGKLPFFKEGYKIQAELLYEIQRLEDTYGKAVIARHFDRLTELLDGAEVSAERLRGQLLSQGTFNIKENGVDKVYDYGFDSSKQFKTESTLWSADGATPLKSFLARLEDYETLNGEKAGIALMTSEVFDKLRNDPVIADVFSSLAVPNPAPTKDEVKAYIENKGNISIVIYDKQYKKARDFKGVGVKYLATDRYTLLPNRALGQTIYGETPEQLALSQKRPSSNLLDGVVTSGYVTVTTWEIHDPVNIETKVSEVVAPSCPEIDKLYIVKVL